MHGLKWAISLFEPTLRHLVPMQYAFMTAITDPTQNKITATVNITKSSVSYLDDSSKLFSSKLLLLFWLLLLLLLLLLLIMVLSNSSECMFLKWNLHIKLLNSPVDWLIETRIMFLVALLLNFCKSQIILSRFNILYQRLTPTTMS